MTRIQNILVGVDLHHGDRLASQQLGDESQAAVDESLLLAATWGASLTFCSVLEISAQSQSLIDHDHQNILKTVEDVASEVLTKLVEYANSNGISAEKVVRFGSAWEELSKASATGNYDLLIIGTRSRNRTSTMLFGSTSHKLMKFSPCPVWVVKPNELREIREVAIATDLSPSAQPAFEMGVTVARAIQARLFVVHVLESSDLRYLSIAGVAEEEIARTEDRLRQTADDRIREQLHLTDYRALPHGVKIEHLNGSPDVAITDFVAKNGVDLLVIGTHGRSGVSGLLLGNTAERLLPGLHSSLLAVKPVGFQSPYAKAP
jgi:universal stress protein E